MATRDNKEQPIDFRGIPLSSDDLRELFATVHSRGWAVLREWLVQVERTEIDATLGNRQARKPESAILFHQAQGVFDIIEALKDLPQEVSEIMGDSGVQAT